MNRLLIPLLLLISVTFLASVTIDGNLGVGETNPTTHVGTVNLGTVSAETVQASSALISLSGAYLEILGRESAPNASTNTGQARIYKLTVADDDLYIRYDDGDITQIP